MIQEQEGRLATEELQSGGEHEEVENEGKEKGQGGEQNCSEGIHDVRTKKKELTISGLIETQCWTEISVRGINSEAKR